VELRKSLEAEAALVTTAEREKTRVALSSVIAAVFLTGFKAVVGVMTGSLGILAEALHSALDLAAAVMTYAAVKIAARPPDDSHHYGHGKVESFSALFETLLLIVTCLWIIHEAIQRLFFKTVEVDPSVWAFLVMFVSIAIDYSRSRALMRAARRYQSQALEADALHFSTDIWSSLVVILGLVLVRIGETSSHKSTLMRADALAALGVAIIVLWVSVRLGKQTMDVLMDKAPAGLALRIAQAAQGVPGVLGCRQVRLRRVGPILFTDMAIDIPRATPLEQAHAIASQIEERVRRLMPKADVVVHTEPAAHTEESWPERIQAIAGQQGLVVHEVRVHDVDGRRSISMHLEVEPSLNLADAHRIADQLEEAIRLQLPGVMEVKTHIEPRMIEPLPGDAAPERVPEVTGILAEIAGSLPRLQEFHDVSVQCLDRHLVVSMHCVFDGRLKIDDVHRLSSQIESLLKARLPEVDHVHIHVEPPEGA